MLVWCRYNVKSGSVLIKDKLNETYVLLFAPRVMTSQFIEGHGVARQTHASSGQWSAQGDNTLMRTCLVSSVPFCRSAVLPLPFCRCRSVVPLCTSDQNADWLSTNGRTAKIGFNPIYYRTAVTAVTTQRQAGTATAQRNGGN